MLIDYQLLIDEAMLNIVKKVLENVAHRGLVDDQCFYISFRTDRDEVILSGNMKKRYPNEITIVLQHQFKNLLVSEDRFSVNIAFGGMSETIEVPFMALTSFIDPAANFSLNFKQTIDFMSDEIPLEDENNIRQLKAKKSRLPQKKLNKNEQKEGKVIEIDKFRKKNK
jgi:hypothetical protein